MKTNGIPEYRVDEAGSVDPLAQERGEGAKVRSEECKKCCFNVAGRCAATDPFSQCRRVTPENIAHSFRRMLEERAATCEGKVLAAAIGNAVVDVATKASKKRYARMTTAEQAAALEFLTSGDAENVGSLAGFDGEWLRGKIRRVLVGITQAGQQSGIGYAIKHAADAGRRVKG